MVVVAVIGKEIFVVRDGVGRIEFRPVYSDLAWERPLCAISLLNLEGDRWCVVSINESESIF